MMVYLGVHHNRQISIAKGIGITLMVIGHSGCPIYIHDFIYSFHMVLFYFLSGFFFREDKIIMNAKGYLWKKIKGLYWPYVKWSIVFILFHNFFFDIGFNDNFLANGEIWINIKRSFRGLYQGEHFLGAYWFLISLLWVIFLFSGIIWIKKKLNLEKLVLYSVVIIFLVGLLSIEFKKHFVLQRELMVLPFFYLGYLVGNGRLAYIFNNRYTNFYAFYVCLPILLLFAYFVSLAVGGNNYGPFYSYVITSSCGIYLVMVISDILDRNRPLRIDALFDKLGTKTLGVMTFHFLGFKIMSAILLLLLGMPSHLLREWPVPIVLKAYWLLYSFFGLIFSICIVLLGEKIKSLIVHIFKA